MPTCFSRNAAGSVSAIWWTRNTPSAPRSTNPFWCDGRRAPTGVPARLELNMPSTTAYKAAAIQFEPTMFEKQRNIARLLDLVRVAATAGARLIVAPEMGTTGYCWYDRAEVKPFVETVPGPTTDSFQELAAEFGCYVVIGLPEVDADTDLY